MRRLLNLAPLAFAFAACESTEAAKPTDVPADGGIPVADAAAGVEDASADSAPADACHPGLPSTGFATLAEGASVGINADVVLTENDVPVVAYTAPEGDHVAILLTRWDAVCSRWGAPIKVDTTALHTSGTSRQVSLAYDASNGAVGVAYQVITAPLSQAHGYEIRFASLAKGAASASAPERVDDPAADAALMHTRGAPGLAMAGGKLFAAWWQDFRTCNVSGCHAIVYRSKSAGAWGTESVAPVTADLVASAQGTAVAVDSAGAPGVAFVAVSFQGTVRGEVDFWRPEAGTTSVALGANVGTDDPNVALAFAGTKPRVAAALHLTDTWASDGKALWFAASADGMTWAPAVAIPTEGGALFGAFVALGVNGDMGATVLGDINSGDGNFGNPKISRTTNLTTFTTSGPVKSAFDGSTRSLRAVVRADGKVSAVFANPPNSGPVKAGLVFYQE